MDIASLLLPGRAARKAESGVGAVMMRTNPQLYDFRRSPQKMIAEAQVIAASDVTIRAAERVIANRFATTEWKLEDSEGRTVGEENVDPAALSVLALLNAPYKPQAGDPQTITPRTWSALAALTCRHLGVCGVAFWYLDEVEALAGTPLQVLYINPARMTPEIDANGSLTGWMLDSDSRSGGTHLELDRVLVFYLEPPDNGVFPAGLVQTALGKAQMTTYSDRHVQMTLAAGGRLSGILSPKEGYLEDAVFAGLTRDVRTISEAPDAAKRMLILRGPVEYRESAASMSDLDLVKIAQMTREDKLSLWGVPHSILGIPTPGGLGGGTSKDSDEAIFWQNAVAPRLRAFAEVIQTQLLDRYRKLGLELEFEFEEPEFDDELPLFDMAVKARELPLTNKERRDLIGLDPFGDERDDEVWLPTALAPVYTVPGPQPQPGSETYATGEVEEDLEAEDVRAIKAVSVPDFVRANARRGLRLYEEGHGGDGLVAATIRDARELAAGRVSEAKVRRIGPWIARHLVDLDAPKNTNPDDPEYPGAGLVAMLLWGAGGSKTSAVRTQRWAEREAAALAGKATIPGLDEDRDRLTRRMQADVDEAIGRIARDVAGRVRKNYDHLSRKPDDASVYWDETGVEKLISEAVLRSVPDIAANALRRVDDALPGKATLLEDILPRLIQTVGLRIKTVPVTMLGDIRRLVRQGIEDGLGAAQLGTLIEERVGNSKYYAERIARTEVMRTQNDATLAGYTSRGIREVIAADGDEDELCASRNGQTFTVEAAQGVEEHPNGTLVWLPVIPPAPVVGKAEPVASLGSVTIPAIRLEPVIHLNVPEQPAPVVNVTTAAPVVNVPAPVVNVAPAEAPVVNVSPPEVVVHLPEQKAGLVQDVRVVEMVARRTSQVVVRDAQGRIVGAELVTE